MNKDTYDVGMDNLRDALHDFLKVGSIGAQERAITDELVAIAMACVCSIDRGAYKELREETVFDDGKSKVDAKMSFSVVLKDDVAAATFSGSIKLKNDAAVSVDDHAQMKLPL